MNIKSMLYGFWIAGFCAFSSGAANSELTKKNILVFITVFLAYLLFCYAAIQYRKRIKPSDKNNQEPSAQWTADS